MLHTYHHIFVDCLIVTIALMAILMKKRPTWLNGRQTPLHMDTIDELIAHHPRPTNLNGYPVYLQLESDRRSSASIHSWRCFMDYPSPLKLLSLADAKLFGFGQYSLSPTVWTIHQNPLLPAVKVLYQSFGQPEMFGKASHNRMAFRFDICSSSELSLGDQLKAYLIGAYDDTRPLNCQNLAMVGTLTNCETLVCQDGASLVVADGTFPMDDVETAIFWLMTKHDQLLG